MPGPAPSARREELLERAYAYALEHGLVDLSLRPLARAIGSSPRVLLFLFESKEGLVRALLGRARSEELAMLARLEPGDDPTAALWSWLTAEEHRPLLTLWVEAYARSLVDPDGPWAGFARDSVDEWRRLLGGDEPAATRRLALLRGALLDLLATGDVDRTTAAVRSA